ncbi:cysteine rich repeat-containing protein [Bradyrhizobium japonicum]|uniref:cysteine rich repeat-containing protein n=1 Tax=Bradyrhizobium japonicum TaxID=375 RepID=UPI00200C9296|nr:cysteine rich repeat-containing protein [Bradyrhizobium japonicum]UQD71700.1 cysteine rich repeat-containing protein [Bradyrhizobium japonicum]
MSRKSVLMATLTLTALSGMSLAPALAQGHMGTPQEQNACSRDASRFCRKDLGNDGAVQACLQANRAKLSKSCSKVFQSHGM